MNKLWIFGDSFSAPFSNNHSIGWSDKYVKWKGYEPKVFGDIIASNLNLKLENHATGGADNYTIFESIAKQSNNILNTDVMIIGWTSLIRYRIIDSNGAWKTILPMAGDLYSELMIHRDDSINPLKEIKHWMSLLTKLYDKRILYWSPAITNDIDIYSPKDLGIIEHISQETKGKITDSHYSELGHQTLSTIFLSMMTNRLI